MDTQTTCISTFRKQRITLPIYDLSCGGGGALMVERAILKVSGVVYGIVNPCTEMVYVEFNPTVCCPNQIVAAIKRAGFEVGEARFM